MARNRKKKDSSGNNKKGPKVDGGEAVAVEGFGGGGFGEEEWEEIGFSGGGFGQEGFGE